MARSVILTNTSQHADRVERDFRNRAVTIAPGQSRAVIMADKAAARVKRINGALKIEIGPEVDDEKAKTDRSFERGVIIETRKEIERRAEGGDAGAGNGDDSALRDDDGPQMTAEQLLAYADDRDNYDHNLFVRQARGVLGDELEPGPAKKKDVVKLLERRVSKKD